MVKLKVKVEPPLSKEDRKKLSSEIQALKQSRPGYFRQEFTMQYRGSKVTITPPREN